MYVFQEFDAWAHLAHESVQGLPAASVDSSQMLGSAFKLFEETAPKSKAIARLFIEKVTYFSNVY